MAGPSLMDSLFQRSLEDLIKGLRIHTAGGTTAGGESSSFIAKSIDEIRREIKSTDLHTKSTALQKLTYLHSLHAVDMSWAAFHAVELTSSPVFLHKKIGYLAASLSFTAATPVLLLLTNQLRKDLSSANEFEVSLALESLSLICTPEFASDLTPDIFTLLGTSKNFVKRKAIATLLTVFSQYPDAVRVCFKRLVENLETGGGGGNLQNLSATVGVFCELASKEPRSYLPLAPEFYRILVDSRNNWVLIKVLKVFAKLAPFEPRLAKKVVEPICDHMQRSGAKSLVFECVRTIVSSFSDYESAMKLAVSKIREFLLDDDPNLKYLGLHGLLLIAPNHLWAVLENKEVVIKSLSDADQNIKFEALRLVVAMVSEDNVAEICKVLISYALKSDPDFCNDILRSILSTCSRNVYEIIVDFDWYVSLLGEMARIPHCQTGEEIEYQLIDIGMRVKDVRPELARVGRDLLIDPALLGNAFIHRILSAAAWISGEYILFSRNPFEIMEALLQPRTNLLPPLIRAVYLHSAFKVLAFCSCSYLLLKEDAFPSSSCTVDMEPGYTYSDSERDFPESSDLIAAKALSGCKEGPEFNPRVSSHTSVDLAISSLRWSKKDVFTEASIVNVLALVETALNPLASSHDVEIQERVRNIRGLANLVQQYIPGSLDQKEKCRGKEALGDSYIVRLMYDAFLDELGPVSASAQGRVPVPDGLVLEENLKKLETFADFQFPVSDLFTLEKPRYGPGVGVSTNGRQPEEEPEPSTESTSLLAEHRKRHGLFYLPTDKDKIAPTEYPPANESNTSHNDVEELVKLTEESLVLKRKPNQTKPRPVVVKLDEGDGIPIAANKVESKDELISGAVRDLLSGDRRGKEQPKVGQDSNMGKPEAATSSSRRSKTRNHGKDRKHRSPGEDVEGGKGNDERNKQKSGKHGRRHKSRQRADGAVNVVAEATVIPDFLL